MKKKVNKKFHLTISQTKLPQFVLMQPEGIPMEARKLLLERASQGTSNFVMNK
jgi:hypothetical protein